MIQPKGEPSGLKAHLGSRGTPRFFAETFLVPWCEQAIESKTFDVKLSNFYVNSIREEIKRLDVNKLEMKKLSKSTNAAESSEAKCVSKGCSFQGLNPNNKSAVGVCAKCGSFEHFACVKIKAEHKEDILKGTMKYYCSACFSKNPSICSNENLKSARPRLDSLPLMGQGYLFKVTQTTTATAISSSPAKVREITAILKCENCE